MIPNLLTTARLILVPIFAYLVLGCENLPAAVMVFVLSGVTDVVDGWIARRWHMITDFGKVYDPLVDKLMQITALVCLALAEKIPMWLVAAGIAKEGLMILCGGVLYAKKIVVSSHWYGKLSTVLLYAVVVTMTLWQELPYVLRNGMIAVLVLAMTFSAIAYLVDILKNYEEKRVSKSHENG